jgi:hypothetical protein
MFPKFSRTRASLLSHGALALALALGAAGGAALVATPAAAKAKEAAPQFSNGFRALAAPLQKELSELGKKAGDPAAVASAKAKLEAAFAAVQTPDDKLVAGQFAIQLGSIIKDPAIQRRGLETTLASGKLAAADVGKFQFYLGNAAFGTKDYATARTALSAAVASGYKENDAEAMLAEAYFADNQAGEGLKVLMLAIESKRASGTIAPENWYRRGLGVAYKGKLLDSAQIYSTALVRDYPSTENWAGAIAVLREIGKFQAQETLDLMRLVDRTQSFMETNDYIEYLQAADARRSPGEVLKILDKGMASGKLSTSDIFVTDVKTQATARLAADKASLPALEKDARAPTATAATVMAAGDAFLSYDQASTAETFYQMVLGKPGIDTARALTRLGIAQADQGKWADAQATFAKVDGVRKPIAQLWLIYIGQKAKAPAA